MKYYFFFIIGSFAFNFGYSQHKSIDTIYIKYDAHCLKKVKNPEDKKIHYIFSANGKNGSFWFNEKEKVLKSSTKKNILLCKNVVGNESFYTYRDNPNLINKYEVYKYFKEKTVFLIKRDEIIHITPHYTIE